MSKSLVTRLFFGSLIAIVAGILVLVASVTFAYANGVFVMDGPDVVGIESSAVSWTFVALGVLGILALVGGGIGQFVAWIGAVINTARLEDKTWFILLLVLGLLSFGFIPMVVYVLIGPDGTQPASRSTSVPHAV